MEPFQEDNSRSLITRYFKLVSGLQKGQISVVKRLMDLWQIDGILEITGIKSEKQFYAGQMAIHTFYKDRVTNGFVKNQEGTIMAGSDEEVLLDMDMRIKTMEADNKGIQVNWTATLVINDDKIVNIPGWHLFNFNNGKIVHLSISLFQKPFLCPNGELKKSGLSSSEIEKLSAALTLIV